MNTLTNLERATDILKRIKEVDAEIIAIERVAVSLANKETCSLFTMTVTDLTPPPAEKVGIDSDGSLIQGGGRASGVHGIMMMHGLPVPFHFEGTKAVRDDCAPTTVHRLSATVTTSVALRLVAVMMQDVNEKRARLLKELETLGFPI